MLPACAAGRLILGGGEPLFKVREVDGWKNRGRTTQGEFARAVRSTITRQAPPPLATRRRWGSSSRAGLIRSRPLCHVLQAFDDTAIVVAAGVANHAGPGRGGPLSGNSSVYGLEVEHPGTTRVGLNRSS